MVFVQVPDMGAEVVVGATVTEVESTKSVSDIYAPVSGTVAVNDALADARQRLNEDPYGDGFRSSGCSNPGDGLELRAISLDASAYRTLVEG